jgi:hypothetical protein
MLPAIIPLKYSIQEFARVFTPDTAYCDGQVFMLQIFAIQKSFNPGVTQFLW